MSVSSWATRQLQSLQSSSVAHDLLAGVGSISKGTVAASGSINVKEASSTRSTGVAARPTHVTSDVFKTSAKGKLTG